MWTEEIWPAILPNIPLLLAFFGISFGTGICVIAAYLISDTNTHRHFLKHHLQDAAKEEIRDKDEKIRVLTSERVRLLEENKQLDGAIRGVHASLEMYMPNLFLMKNRRKSG